MGNLSTPATEWLKEQFAFEWCADCGRDHRHHTVLPFLGNWFARCDREPIFAGEELICNPEGYGE